MGIALRSLVTCILVLTLSIGSRAALVHAGVMVYPDDFENMEFPPEAYFSHTGSVISNYPADAAPTITRALFLAEMLTYVDLYQVPAFTIPSTFSFFKDYAGWKWYSAYLLYAQIQGIVEGYGDYQFHGDRVITLAEALKMLFRQFDMEYDQPKTGEEWHMPIMKRAQEAGVLEYVWAMQFNDPISRYDMLKLFDNFARYKVDHMESAIPQDARTALNTLKDEWEVVAVKPYTQLGGVWSQEVREQGGTTVVVMYNEDLHKAFILPWWNYNELLGEYGDEDGLWDQVGAPLENWTQDEDGNWIQHFQKATMIWSGEEGTSAQILPLN